MSGASTRTSRPSVCQPDVELKHVHSMVFHAWLDVRNGHQMCGAVVRIRVARKEDNADVALLQRVAEFFFECVKVLDGEVFAVENFYAFASQHFSNCASISYSVC